MLKQTPPSHPISTDYAGPMLWELEQASEVMQRYREFITQAPEDISGAAHRVSKNDMPWTYRDNYERLVTIKNKYDPTNLLRVNQNIKPTG